ncbi:helix-turn-helix domain-containing protein [Flintibacter porci]|uniref:helix-turn-helix domain-containing protein n=1 Tax=Flintibacter porci TaxID=3342383 RepID=UPI003F8926C3
MRHDESYDYPDWREKLPAILTPLDVMDILGVGKNTVYNLLASGQLKGFRIGKSWRITGDALEEFLLLR